MKIAHLICVFKPYKGGMGNAAAQFAGVLARKGHEITVLTPDYGQADFFSGEADDGFTVRRLKPLFSIGNAACLPQLAWQLRDFDVIHFHYPFYGATLPVLLASLFKRRSSKLIVHYHMDSMAEGFRGMIFALNRRFVWPLLFKRAHLITAASLDYVQHSQIADSYRRHPEKFFQVPFGVDADAFACTPLPRTWPKQILFVGGLDQAHYFKGIAVLLEAFGKVRSERQLDVVLTIVGSGGLKDQYAAQAEQLGVAERVHFAGKVSDQELARHYREASVLVLPSINQGEAFGLVLLEAMASGRPVVASNLPGVRGVFTSPSEGLVAEPGDAADLAAKLATILSDDALAESMGQAARKKVESTYRLPEIANLLEQAYRQ
jgi:glycosyltransferase involved in cell wall biosynthesis